MFMFTVKEVINLLGLQGKFRLYQQVDFPFFQPLGGKKHRHRCGFLKDRMRSTNIFDARYANQESRFLLCCSGNENADC